MNPAITCVFVFLFVVLSMASLIQLLYLESLRLLAKETAVLAVFQDELEQGLGVATEKGALVFSLWKHFLMVTIGVLCFGMVITRAQIVETRLILPILLESLMIGLLAIVLAGYIVPQFLYRKTSGHWLRGFTPLLRVMILAMLPVTMTFDFLNSVFELGQVKAAEQANEKTEAEQVEAFIDAGADEGIIEQEDKRLIQSVVAFGDKRVREVMTPRPNIVGIEAGQTLEELRKLAVAEKYSRFPVFEDSIDQVIGFVHVRDLFEQGDEERHRKKAREMMRPIPHVPETKLVGQMLREMQEEGTHMSMVIDEYGNTAGLATMEDLVEEILGEIRDEHEPSSDVRGDGEGFWIVAGSYDLDGLEHLLKFRPQGNVEATTVGGLAVEWCGRVPLAGEFVERDGLRIAVVSSSARRVDQVRVSAVSKEVVGPEIPAGKE